MKIKQPDIHQSTGVLAGQARDKLPALSPIARACGMALMFGGLAAGKAAASESVDVQSPSSLTFDSHILEERGIDPELANYFRAAPRFQPGNNIVTLVVNGVPKGRTRAQFDSSGELCVDDALLAQAGLLPAAAVAGDSREAGSSCVPFAVSFPGAVVRLNPNKEEVALIVSADALVAQGTQQREYANGGVAGLFNYDALVVRSRYNGQSSLYRSLGTEAGFNAAGWAFRSRQTYTSMRGENRLEHLYAYASRTWEKHGANVQLGQLNMASPLFSGGAFTGIQIQPETALSTQSQGLGSVMTGIAHSPSRVEVRQSGALIHTTMVPTGPFTLSDLPLLSRKIDLEVTVHEESGGQQRFTVPAADLQRASLDAAPGYAFAAGRVRRFGAASADAEDQPLFAAVSKDWQVGRDTRVTGGLMGATGYRSAGWSLQQVLTNTSTITAQQLVSSSQRERESGTQFQTTFATALSSTLAASVFGSVQTQGFRTLSDSSWAWGEEHHHGREKSQFGGSLNWSNSTLGAFRGSYSRASTFDGHGRSQISAGWSRMFDRASVSLSLERRVGGSDEYGVGTTAHLSVNVPLGPKRSARGYISNDDTRGLRRGLRVTEQASDTLGYSIGAERDDSGQVDISGRVNLLPRYAQLNAGYSRRGTGQTSYNAGVRGGLAVHRDGVTLSPYPLRDTFAVLQVGDQAGVKLRTPSGPVWTDAGGRAVSAQLHPYRTSRFEIETFSLPRNVDVSNGYREITAGRGSVHHIGFDVVTVRRLLLTAQMVDGEPVSKGVAVYDSESRYVTTVLDAGKIFLTDARPDMDLHVVLADGTRCGLAFDLASKPDPNALYESTAATCRPL